MHHNNAGCNTPRSASPNASPRPVPHLASAVSEMGWPTPWPRARLGCSRTELLHRRGPWKGLEDVELPVLEWVGWHNQADCIRLVTTCRRLSTSRSTTVNTQPEPRLESRQPESPDTPGRLSRNSEGLRDGRPTPAPDLSSHACSTQTRRVESQAQRPADRVRHAGEHHPRYLRGWRISLLARHNRRLNASAPSQRPQTHVGPRAFIHSGASVGLPGEGGRLANRY